MSVTLTDRLSTFEVASASTLSNGLIYCWKMDETSGTTLSSSVGTNDITSVTGTINQDGKSGKAVLFADQEGVVTTSPTAGKSEVTISMWVYINTADVQDHTLWGEYYDGTNYYFQFWLTNTRFLHRSVTTGYSGARLGDLNYDAPELEWFHIVCTYSVANTLKAVYVNGSLAGSTSSGVAALTTERTSVKVATDDETVPNHLDGLIDEVCFWNRQLTSDEIAELYNSGSGKFYPFL